MDIVLINPPFNLFDTLHEDTDYGNTKEHQTYCYPPLGIAYIAANLKDACIIDSVGSKLDIKETVSLTLKQNPKVIGISVTTFSLHSTKEMITELKKHTKAKLVIGGPHVTYDPSIITHIPADYGIKGEAEESFPKLCQRIINKKKIHVAGLITKKRYDVKRAHIENLDSLPFPARDLLPEDKYFFSLHSGKFTTIITTRGCIYDCIYCALPDKKKYRKRSIENIMQELRMLVSTGYTYIDFQDDLFTLDKNRTIELCNHIIDEGLHFSWGCATRIELVDEETLRIMKKAGCDNIRYGIESGSYKIRKIIGKPFTYQQIKKVVDLTKRNKIHTVLFFSLGHPGETAKDIRLSLKLAKELRADYIQFVIIAILPGSRLYELALKEGKVSSDIWKKVAEGNKIPFYIPDKINLKDMKAIQKKAYRYFYLSPIAGIKNLMKSHDLKDFFLKIYLGFVILYHITIKPIIRKRTQR